MGSFGLSEKGPLSVRISDRSGGLLQAIPADLAVKGAAANFEMPSCLMIVPVGFLIHSQYQTSLIQIKRGGGNAVCLR